jgi:phage I-like protein
MFSIHCSAANPLPSEICFMPEGRHSLNAKTVGGGSFAGTVLCDEAAAERVIASFNELKASGQRMILDLDHSDSAAAADVESMRWQPGKGIMAAIKWQPLGASALINREFTSFSPCFLANEFTGEIAGLVPNHALGGLVNFPAFQSAMPRLIAARLGDPGPTDEDQFEDENFAVESYLAHRHIQRQRLEIIS